jgi:predicted TIM-barrel fold metal-dependent hydrolase
MNRRSFLFGPAAAAFAQERGIPIIDTHIHLFDTERPGGVPWPPKSNAKLYRPALPARYRAIAEPLGVVGAIEVEASPLVEDNQWVLDIAKNEPILVGTVGHLEPGAPEFRKQLERFGRNPLFRGIRFGNLWGRDIGDVLGNAGVIGDLKALAAAGLAMDVANPNPRLMESVARVTDRVADLRVVIDHLPQMDPRTAEGSLRELAKRPQVYVKGSSVLRRVDGRVPEDLGFYRPRLDELFGLFGEDRILYGSDWPNSDNWGEYPLVLRIVREYFTAKGRAVAEKYFWRNSAAAYRWVKRAANQPGLVTESGPR